MRIWDTPIKLRNKAMSEPQIWSCLTGVSKTGEDAINKLIKAGNPFTPCLVALPTSPNDFHHPGDLPDPYGQRFFERVHRNRKLTGFIALAYAAISLIVLLVVPSLKAIAGLMGSFCLLTTAYFALDNRLTYQNRSHFSERCRYYGWLFTSGPTYAWYFLAVFVVSGTIQFLLGSDQFLESYGLLFYAPLNEWWRVVSGSLIHSGPAHWLTNLSLALIIAIVSGPSLRLNMLPVFFFGGVFAFAVAFLWANWTGANSDGLVGTSGGLAALLGCQITLIIKYRSSYPKLFLINVAFFFLIAFILSPLFIPSVSLACHLAGALFGLLFGVYVRDYLNINV